MGALGTTSGELSASEEGSGRVFPCEACGADLVFDAGRQVLRCTRCDFTRAVRLDGAPPVQEQDLTQALERLSRERHTGAVSLPAEELSCDSCGAKVVFAGNVTSKECEYCGAPRQRGGVHRSVERVPVDGVLPFQVEQRAAAGALAEWVRSRWFAPNEFLRRGVEGRFSGSYLPYWTYDAMTASWYTGERGEHYYVTVERNNQKVQERRTRWYPASGSFSRFFDDVMVCAATGLPAGVVQALEPWPLERVVPYTQQLLAGYGAKTYDLSVSDGFKEAKQRMDAALRREAARRIGGDDQRVHSVRTRYEALTFKHLLLPVWMLTYRYADKPYRVIVNATTGEVQGERPYSAVKIALAVLVGLIIAGLLLYFEQQRR